MKFAAFHGFMILVLMVFFISEESESCYVKTNGCSIPFGAPFPYKGTFRPVCNKHDVCYSCGSLRKWKRRTCDKAFHRDMRALCKSEARRRKRCRIYAKIYYRVVRWFGGSHYNKHSPSWCKQRCVIRYGSPYRYF